MTDISVRHDLSSGAAAIEIRGAGVNETRFRLRDPYTEKYLTRRGWTKAAAFLPGEAVRSDDLLTLTLLADLAGKIKPGTNLVLEQPAADFQEVLNWPAPTAIPADEPQVFAPVAAEEETSDADEPLEEHAAEETSAEPPAAEETNAEAPGTDAPATDEPAAEEAVANEPHTPAPEPEPLKLDSFEPTIMHDRLQDTERPRDDARAYAGDNDNRRSTWKPAAIGAALCLLLGAGIGYLWSGSTESTALKEARASAAMQLEKQKWDFDRRLKEATEQASASGKTNASDTKIAGLSDKFDAAQKALADKEKSIATLQKQLDDANARIEAVQNTAGDKAKAEIDVLDKKITALNAELDKAKAALADRDSALKTAQAKLEDANSEIASVRDTASSQQAAQSKTLTDKINALQAEVKRSEEQLAQRDAALRDVQAKLSVANIQIDALKTIANKTTQAGLEKTAMSQKIAELSAELDKTGQSLSDREQALADATAKLRDAESKLAAANKRNDELVASAGQDDAVAGQAPAGENAAQLQQERDLYSNELKTMTGKFSALQAEKAALEKTVAQLQSQIKDTGVATSNISPKAIWGATAIDRNGAIYSVQNQPSEKMAQDNVAAMCRGKSGARCEALSSYSNACFSVARFEGEQPAPDNYAYFVHKNRKTASQTALERCESMGLSCTVRFTACSPDTLSKSASD